MDFFRSEDTITSGGVAAEQVGADIIPNEGEGLKITSMAIQTDLAGGPPTPWPG